MQFRYGGKETNDGNNHGKRASLGRRNLQASTAAVCGHLTEQVRVWRVTRNGDGKRRQRTSTNQQAPEAG